MTSRHERKAAALEAIADALLELAAVEREPDEAVSPSETPIDRRNCGEMLGLSPLGLRSRRRARFSRLPCLKAPDGHARPAQVDLRSSNERGHTNDAGPTVTRTNSGSSTSQTRTDYPRAFARFTGRRAGATMRRSSVATAARASAGARS